MDFRQHLPIGRVNGRKLGLRIDEAVVNEEAGVDLGKRGAGVLGARLSC